MCRRCKNHLLSAQVPRPVRSADDVSSATLRRRRRRAALRLAREGRDRARGPRALYPRPRRRCLSDADPASAIRPASRPRRRRRDPVNVTSSLPGTRRGILVLAPRANSALLEVKFHAATLNEIVEDFNENYSTRALTRPVLRDLRDRKECVPGKTLEFQIVLDPLFPGEGVDLDAQHEAYPEPRRKVFRGTRARIRREKRSAAAAAAARLHGRALPGTARRRRRTAAARRSRVSP